MEGIELDSKEIPSALSIRSISLILEMLEGKELNYEELKERYEISYSTFKRHIKEIKENLNERQDERYILITNKEKHYKLIQFTLPYMLN